MKKRWLVAEPHSDQIRQIAQEYELSPIVSQLLINRKLTTPQDIQHFLQPSLAHLPDPALLKDMDRAVDRLVQAVRQQEPITIYGDYDVDGTTSTVLLMNFFQALGVSIDYYIPNRLKEGYSLNSEAVEQIAKRGTKVLITVDNGISAHTEVEHAQALGMDVIVTDHHEVPKQLPKAYAILNPKQAGDAFPGKELAGVGVAYYLLIGLRRALREAGLLPDKEPNLRQALDLVAVGTIADLAPLTGINRILVHEGLKVLSQCPRPGFQALLQVSGVDGEVRADQVAFRVGPRINAVGRLEDASTGVQLLLSEDPTQCRQWAEQLDTANLARKELEDRIVTQARALIEEQGILEKFRSLVLYAPDWHAGVVGIVASRLVEIYYRPAIVLTRDAKGLKGSARSIRNFNLVNALKKCEDLLEKFGGHAYAAGLSLKEENLVAFQKRFDQIVRDQLKPEDFAPALAMDAESPLENLDPNFMEQLKRFEPFGLGNPAPLFLLKKATVRQSRVVGERHLKMRVGASTSGPSFDAIGFRLAAKQPEMGAAVDLAYVPEWNEWNGIKNIQLRFVDLREPD